ncbi:5'/3'-nucleotidase SurE [Brevibacillus centrosporus]|uniref:5'-nucleotidase SurE n=1 Tax=Brevibacillus centrosporus TaxID=54910 RepID=A0A1I3SAZ6_9BACL|nr:5'/3'-nucleotidase SurE [Brevibacillus centrosporus]MEC2131893.1 5'/3'-nucleotidase SurE [Brevibacillus centrosporus]RNB64010.1 5'/3'-nucleotidase SurE [Brevibacillus centrosporus]GED34203.1 5'-nucleotidase SurE [Brevibacillus centrosporus]SFJ55570.1 5'-nucleotidase /3'-nucleotidase /exopolyphosphatase [Brevibacillus centrosporus]
MLRILITNDDGIDALGIRRLTEALLTLEGAEIYVVAPQEEKSGVGHGVTFRSALEPQEHDFYGLPVKAWAINGNPADCVKAAYHLLFEDDQKPDIVFSGINVGTNLGRDIYYSGTCSGAREAVILGIPGIALSYDNWFDQDNYGEVVEMIQPLIQEFSEKAKKGELPQQVFWNVNIPHVPQNELKGIVPASLSLNHYEDKYNKEGAGYYLVREYPEVMPLAEPYDYDLLKHGYIAITPVHIDATDRDLLKQLDEWTFIKSWGKREG